MILSKELLEETARVRRLLISVVVFFNGSVVGFVNALSLFSGHGLNDGGIVT